MTADNGDRVTDALIEAGIVYRDSSDGSIYNSYLEDVDLTKMLDKARSALDTAYGTRMMELLPEQKVGTDTLPLDQAEIGYNIGIQDCVQIIKETYGL